MENLQESGVLKELGLNGKNNWILYDEKPRAFFQHLARNIDSDNILTESELKKYNQLLSTGQFLEDDALLEELKALELNYSGILSVTDEDIDSMERELKFIKSDNLERNDRLERMETSAKRQRQSAEAFEEKSFEIDYQRKQLEKESLQKANSLSELQQLNQKQVVELKKTYSQPSYPPVLVYQMPLDQYILKFEQILAQLELFMRNNFGITNTHEEPNDWQSNSSVFEIKKRIQEMEEKNFEKSLTLAGWQNLIENLDQYKYLSFNEMCSMSEEIEMEIENLNLQLAVIQKEAYMLVEQSSEREIVKVFHEHLKAKNKRAL